MFVHEGESTWHARNVLCSFWYCSMQLLCTKHQSCLQQCTYNYEQFSSRCLIKNDVSTTPTSQGTRCSTAEAVF